MGMFCLAILGILNYEKTHLFNHEGHIKIVSNVFNILHGDVLSGHSRYS